MTRKSSMDVGRWRPGTAGDGNLPLTAVPSVRPRPASKKTAPFRPSSGRTGRLTTLVWSVLRVQGSGEGVELSAGGGGGNGFIPFFVFIFLLSAGTTGSEGGAPLSSQLTRRRRGLLRSCHTLMTVNTVWLNNNNKIRYQCLSGGQSTDCRVPQSCSPDMEHPAPSSPGIMSPKIFSLVSGEVFDWRDGLLGCLDQTIS